MSFVSPKAVPQLADSEAVLAALQPPNDVEIIGIVVNAKCAERARATGAVTTLGFPLSLSETFLRRNQNQSPTDTPPTPAHLTATAPGLGVSIPTPRANP